MEKSNPVTPNFFLAPDDQTDPGKHSVKYKEILQKIKRDTACEMEVS